MNYVVGLGTAVWLLTGLLNSAQAGTVQGKIINEKGQRVDEAEVFLVAEALDYGEYQFVSGGAFVFIDVPMGEYMLYARLGKPPEDPDRPEATQALEIKEEKQVYAIELRLKPPYRLKFSSSPEIKRSNVSEGSKGTGSP